MLGDPDSCGVVGSLLNDARRPSRLRGGVELMDSLLVAAGSVSICNCGRDGEDDDNRGLEVSATSTSSLGRGEGGGGDDIWQDPERNSEPFQKS